MRPCCNRLIIGEARRGFISETALSAPRNYEMKNLDSQVTSLLYPSRVALAILGVGLIEKTPWKVRSREVVEPAVSRRRF